MFQREVADRILGRSAGAKGPLWVLSAMLYDLKRVAQVPPSAFRPAPKVHSSVIAFAPRDDDAAVLARRQLPTYWHILTQAFGNRRKMLRNTLKAYDAPVVREYDTKRAEELSLDDWQRVFDACVGLKFS